ncbi:MAG: hypothetical protein ABI340_04945 [Nitrososphaera sp.]|jgi:hypothetical protein
MRHPILAVVLTMITSTMVLPHAFSEDMENVQLGTNFEISTNRTISIQPQGLMIQLVNVTDSRCPSDVTCVWAGQASIDLALQMNGKNNLLTLVSSAGNSSTKAVGIYIIHLVKVDPYPTSKKHLQLSDYIISLKVTANSPLKQFKAGIAAKDVTCMQGYTLVIKSNGGTPACVTPETASKLATRGWTLSVLTP